MHTAPPFLHIVVVTARTQVSPTQHTWQVSGCVRASMEVEGANSLGKAVFSGLCALHFARWPLDFGRESFRDKVWGPVLPFSYDNHVAMHGSMVVMRERSTQPGQ